MIYTTQKSKQIPWESSAEADRVALWRLDVLIKAKAMFGPCGRWAGTQKPRQLRPSAWAKPELRTAAQRTFWCSLADGEHARIKCAEALLGKKNSSCVSDSPLQDGCAKMSKSQASSHETHWCTNTHTHTGTQIKYGASCSSCCNALIPPSVALNVYLCYRLLGF